jgi:hypothetical protein
LDRRDVRALNIAQSGLAEFQTELVLGQSAAGHHEKDRRRPDAEEGSSAANVVAARPLSDIILRIHSLGD